MKKDQDALTRSLEIRHSGDGRVTKAVTLRDE